MFCAPWVFQSNFCFRLTILFKTQKLAKSEEEDIAGTYFKPQRANRIMAQAQETKKNGGNARWRNKLHFDIMLNSVFLFIIGLSKPSSTTSTSLSASNLVSNSNLSSSFNSGLNTFGLNNSYTGNNMNGGSNGVGAFGNGGGGGGGTGGGRGGGGGLGGGGGGGGGISGAGSWGGPSCKSNWRQVWLSSEKIFFLLLYCY